MVPWPKQKPVFVDLLPYEPFVPYTRVTTASTQLITNLPVTMTSLSWPAPWNGYFSHAVIPLGPSRWPSRERQRYAPTAAPRRPPPAPIALRTLEPPPEIVVARASRLLWIVSKQSGPRERSARRRKIRVWERTAVKA